MVKSPGRCQTVGARKKKQKKKAKWGGGRGIEQRSRGCCQSRLNLLLVMVLFRISVFFELWFGFYQREINK